MRYSRVLCNQYSSNASIRLAVLANIRIRECLLVGLSICVTLYSWDRIIMLGCCRCVEVVEVDEEIKDGVSVKATSVERGA